MGRKSIDNNRGFVTVTDGAEMVFTGCFLETPYFIEEVYHYSTPSVVFQYARHSHSRCNVTESWTKHPNPLRRKIWSNLPFIDLYLSCLQ